MIYLSHQCPAAHCFLLPSSKYSFSRIQKLQYNWLTSFLTLAERGGQWGPVPTVSCRTPSGSPAVECFKTLPVNDIPVISSGGFMATSEAWHSLGYSFLWLLKDRFLASSASMAAQWLLCHMWGATATHFPPRSGSQSYKPLPWMFHLKLRVMAVLKSTIHVETSLSFLLANSSILKFRYS